MTVKELIFNSLDDLVSDLFYYDRKEDEELPLGAIEEAIRSGAVTEGELVEKFSCLVATALDHSK